MIEHVVLAGLAGWRIASLLNWEPGPWNVLGRMRWAAGVPREGGEITGELAKLILCPWCVTVYTSAGMLAAGAFLSWWIPALFAAMAVAMIADRWSTIATAIDRRAK